MRWPRVRRDQSPALALLNLTGRPCCQLAPYMSPDLCLEMQISWALPTCSTRVVCCPSLRRWGMARPPSKGMTCSSLGKREPHNSFWQAISLCVSIDASCRQSGMAACHLPIWITIERISFFSLFRIPDHLNASCEILSGFDFQRCFFFGLCSAVVCWHYEMPPCCQDWFCSALWNIDIPGAGFCWC